ncbi:hypothetical protein HVA01_32350 [Halovibrio variabilis]|uniref:Glycosyltransferase 2-like domain-containing protein n=1 Tax=Halovibrio variabilis TaxID=31910 RepID=A0A511USM4_9GAMM|nr:glycosyltransferase family A protein [Halovibrio variabilis]GEN29589.1 hypothetical protein HVA01_32350 [Halovibrio variabilis]
MDSPLVSVIIPVYNAEKYIHQCIKSVMDQSYKNIEIVTINDGSSDRSLEELLLFKDKIEIIDQKNFGAPVARNKGLLVSKGKYVKFLDSDDYLEPDVISEQVSIAESHTDNDIIYGDYYIYRNNSKKLIKTDIKYENSTVGLLLKDILTSTPLHRREHIVDIGGFDERLPNGQEWNLHVRLAARGYNFIYCSMPVYTYRVDHSNETITNISTRDSYKKVKLDIDKILTVKNVINHDADTLSAVSKRFWWIGRHCLRLGYSDLAEQAFSEALKEACDYKKYWPISYRALNFFLGTSLTETVVKLKYLNSK